MPCALGDPVTKLSGVGPQMAIKLAKLHVETVQDVLFHLPHRYEDRTKVTAIGALQANVSTVVIGQIELAQVVIRRRRSLLVRISDGTGSLTIRLFYFSRAQEKAFKRGLWVRCFGEPRLGMQGYEFIHPEYRVHAEQPQGGLASTLTPVYPTTEGVSQTLWRKVTEQALKDALPGLPELLPDAVLKTFGVQVTTLHQALQLLHRPAAKTALQDMQEANSLAHQRLIFEELLAHHLSLRQARLNRQSEQAIKLAMRPDLQQALTAQFGFELTRAQQRVAQEVASDLQTQTPMMRLVQGDVGSGKTVIAALAMLQAVSQGVQAVLMAPTELLAEQHYHNLSRWFEPLEIEVGWLASKTPAKQKQHTIDELASGKLLLAVGTHALIQEGVDYQCLALVVIDEQHRFGVDQRLALRNKTPEHQVPHQMVMTATPIPRTLAMSFYADLDVSSIDELPPGRQAVETVVIAAQQKRQEVIQRVQVACQQGRQVYWVCPLIEESDALSAQAATDTEQELKQVLQGVRVGLVHGRMKPKEKEQIMASFRQAEIDLLVATTVIEVGVDVPNASLMIVENAERMGLAQLHQLRGRVGRGEQQSYCILLYQTPLSQHAKLRLQTLRETNDGFAIAEKDLQIRGAGELLGTRQTGALSFKVADLVRDQSLLPKIEQCAQTLITQQPQLIEPIIKRWVGSKENYMNA